MMTVFLRSRRLELGYRDAVYYSIPEEKIDNSLKICSNLSPMHPESLKLFKDDLLRQKKVYEDRAKAEKAKRVKAFEVSHKDRGMLLTAYLNSQKMMINK